MKHTVYFKAAQNMNLLGDNTIDIVVTSPPYPMIEMWDEIMSSQNYEIKKAFEENKMQAPDIHMGKNYDTNYYHIGETGIR